MTQIYRDQPGSDEPWDELGVDRAIARITETQLAEIIRERVQATLDGRYGPLIDEDDMASNSAANTPSQQSVKAFVDELASAVPSNMGSATGWVTLPGTPTTAARTLNKPYFLPLWVPRGGMALDRIACEVTTAGAAGAVVRMGIFQKRAGDERPGTVLLDAGTVSATTTGVKEITIDVTLEPGLHWLCVVSQVAACSMRVNAGSSGVSQMYASSAATALGFAITGFSSADMTGALTSNPFGVTGSADPTRVTVRQV